MRTAADIRDRVQQKPFTPFRITTSSGERFNVAHPDRIWIGRRDLQIGIAAPEEPKFYDRVVRVAILHVTSLRDLPVASAPPTNGSA